MQAIDKQLAPRYRNVLPFRKTRAAMERYAAAMTPGGILTSNFMAMCDVAASEAVRSVKCRHCKGIGGRDGDLNKIALWEEQLRKPDITWFRAKEIREKLSRERECRPCRGTGFRERNLKREEADRIFTTVRCGRCLGSGEVMNEDAEDECPRCQGDGCVVPQTVRETGSSKHGLLPPGATNVADGAAAAWLPPEPDAEDEASAEQRAETLEVLQEVAAADPEAAEAAVLYQGPYGDKWAAHHWGRTFVLWPMTAGGAAIAELYLKRPELRGAGHLIRPLDRIAAARDEESHAKAPNMMLRTLITKADREARVLEARMLGVLADAEAAVAAAGESAAEVG